MASNKTNRIIQAMTETQDGLAREMRYCPELRDDKLIAFYEGHIVKLTAMLEQASA